MKAKPLALALALTAAFSPGIVHAIGLGEIVLHSRIGEALRAEVPILAAPGESPETLCFSLANLRNADFPVITSAKTRIVQRGLDYKLQITSSKPVYDPIFMLGIRAACGADLQRDYVLMPEAPSSFAGSESEPAARMTTERVPSSMPSSKSKGSSWSAREGETLISIAESRTQGHPETRLRLLNAMKRANPDLAPDEPLMEGTPVQIPKVRPRAQASTAPGSSDSPVRTAARREQAAPPAAATLAAPSTPAPKLTSSDRLVLGAAPLDSKTTASSRSPQSASIVEMEERMAQMETTLRLLRMEIEKMDAAISLADKTAEAERKLREAQETQLASIKATPPPPAQSGGGNWLELVLSAVFGGGLAVGIASLLTRRRQTTDFDSLLPPHHQVQNSGFAPSVPPPSPRTTPSVVKVEYNDDNSVLALAEVMLSYGRIEGAAETLAEHVNQHSPDNILPWSMLLDLYRRGGMREEFDLLAQAIHDKFNVEIAGWESSETPISGLRALEEYPHIIKQIHDGWGTTAGLDYLYELVHDTRAGQRQGFPLEVVEEISLLIRMQEDAYGVRRSR